MNHRHAIKECNIEINHDWLKIMSKVVKSKTNVKSEFFRRTAVRVLVRTVSINFEVNLRNNITIFHLVYLSLGHTVIQTNLSFSSFA